MTAPDPSQPTTTSALELRRVQRRIVMVLVTSQALGGLGIAIGIAVASLLARDVSGSESLAGLVQTFQVLGAAVAAYVLARVTGRRGRRTGLVTGYLIGAVGAAVCVAGGTLDSFSLLLLGALMLGANTATNFQSRYAAIDLATADQRGRSLALVVWGTTVGAVLGPNLVGPAGRVATALGLPALVGPFLMATVVTTAAASVLAVLLRPDPLLTARRQAIAAGEPGGEAGSASLRRVVQLSRERPAVGLAIAAMTLAHAVMVGVMVMTPLHMDRGGAELRIVGFVISLHVLGMFFFAPVFGLLSDRFGSRTVLMGGAVTLGVSLLLAGTAPAGASVRIATGLFLLGLGWSAATVAAAVILTEATPLADRTGTQGAADLVMNGGAAVAGALSGVVVDVGGFGWLNASAAVLAVGVLFSAAWLRTTAEPRT